MVWPQFLETSYVSFCSILLSKKDWNYYSFMKNNNKTLKIWYIELWSVLFNKSKILIRMK